MKCNNGRSFQPLLRRASVLAARHEYSTNGVTSKGDSSRAAPCTCQWTRLHQNPELHGFTFMREPLGSAAICSSSSWSSGGAEAAMAAKRASRGPTAAGSTARRGHNQTRFVGAGLALPKGTPRGAPNKCRHALARLTLSLTKPSRVSILTVKPVPGDERQCPCRAWKAPTSAHCGDSAMP